MQKFRIPPNSNSYSFFDALQTLSVKLDGGSSRYRADILNSNFNLNAEWTLNREDYFYFRLFYKNLTNNGILPFLIDLIIDDPFKLVEHEARFIPGSVSLKMQNGYSYTVGATLEVKPKPIDSELIKKYVYDLFDNIVNVQLPDDIL